jgi:hypothetical protein
MLGSVEPRTNVDRWARAALVIAVLWFVAVALATGFQLAVLWDLRAYHFDPWDSAWRLELSWLGAQGAWSGRDFDYPRGPLWQVVGALASTLGRGEPGWTLGLLSIFFSLACLGLALWVVLRHVRSEWGRVFAFLAIAVLTNTVGVATLRGFLPVVAIVLYAPARGEVRPAWRSAFAAAVVTVASGLLSFDRFGTIGLCLAGMSGVELVVRLRRRAEPSIALVRAARFAIALVLVIAVAWVLGRPLGFDVFDYVRGQRELMSAYAVNMSIGWEVAVPPTNLRALFVLCGLLVAALAWPRSIASSTAPAWIAGAMPAVMFASVRSDESHMVMGITPVLVILVLIAAGTFDELRASHQYVAGALAGVALAGWFGTYPEMMAGRLEPLVNVARILRSEKHADPGFDSDVGAIARYASAHRGELRCLAVAADFTVLHPMLHMRGPTELGLRWSPELQHRLAERIRQADCGTFFYSIRNFDAPGHSWPFGEDFVEVAVAYEPVERLGGTAVAMRRRPRRLALPRTTLRDTPTVLEVPVPGAASLSLGGIVHGTDLLLVQLRIDVPAWRSYVGGSPQIEWRFQNGEEEASPWRPLHHLALGVAHTVWVSPDPEAAEERWILGREPLRRREADTLVFRVTERGALTPEQLTVTVLGVEQLRPPTPSIDVTGECDPEVDLLEELREGRALVRWVSPRTSELHFHLEPQPENQPLAEVLFPIVPCEDTCFVANVSVQASPEEGDGVLFDVNVIDSEARPRLLRRHIAPDGEEHEVEVLLGAYAGRHVLLRLGTQFNEHEENDDALVVLPRLERCNARRSLAEALREGAARIAAGTASPIASATDDGSVRIGPAGAEMRWRTQVVRDTCVDLGVRALGEGEDDAVRYELRVAEGDVETVLTEGLARATDPVVEVPLQGLFDWTGRRVEVVFEVRPLEGPTRARLVHAGLRGCGRPSGW